MARDVQQLEALLAKGPEDWSVRITLIEERIRRDDKEGAKQLVRDSPDSSPLPYELQYRLHLLMTRGKSELEPLPSEKRAVAEKLEATQPLIPMPREPVPAAKSKPTREPVPPAKSEHHQEPVPAAKLEPQQKPVLPAKSDPKPPKSVDSEPTFPSSQKPSFDEIAPVKGAAAKAKRDEISGFKKPAPKPEIELKKNTDGAKKWDKYDGKLLLTDSDIEIGERPERQSFFAEKVSALTAAIIVHLVIAVACAFVIIQNQRQAPPELIVSVIHEKEVDLTVTHINKTKEKNLSAAAMQSVNLLSTVGASAMKIPEMEDTAMTNISTPVTGIETLGVGMSFTGAKDKQSDISFFGISGGGDRVIFVIDATRPMLVDEKGGMFAYDKVKNEISAMLNELRRGTYFNVLLYDGRNVVAFREKPVAGLPSNRRKAAEWLKPLNRDYENLGLRNGFREGQIIMAEEGVKPIQSVDLAHYTKCIQKALEWQASAVFCISGGYGRMGQSPTPEMREKYKGKTVTPGTPGKVPPAEAKAWKAAQQKTREWLQKENEARKEKGLPSKVVVNFNALIKQVTGASPPRATGGTPSSGGMPRLPNHTPEDTEKQIQNLVAKYYDEEGREKPSIHMVLFLGKKEKIGDYEDHFKTLTRKNRGKLKVLRGLAELENVTQ